MSIPLYGFLEGDTVGLLCWLRKAETVLDSGAKNFKDAANIRVAYKDRIDSRLQRQGPSTLGLTVAQAGAAGIGRFGR